MSKKYHFKIENVPYVWENQFITGKEVRGIGPGIPDNMDLFLKVAGKPGRFHPIHASGKAFRSAWT